MRILVLGGTAFIGPHVLRMLRAMGHELSVFHRGRTEPDDLPSGIHHVHGDRFELRRHAPTLRELEPQIVLDMAPLGEADARAVMETFVGVARRVVGLSSADVYLAYDILRGREGEPLVAIPMAEDAPLRRQLYPYRHLEVPAGSRVYPRREEYEKILVERELLARPGHLPATILRLPAVFGPRDPLRRPFPYLKRMLDARPAILLGQGESQWRFCRGHVPERLRWSGRQPVD